MVLLWALLVAIAKFPPLARRVGADAEPEPAASADCSEFPRYWLGVLAQFAYVGAQVGVWSFVIRYTQFNFPGTAEKVARQQPAHHPRRCSSPAGSSARC